MKLIPNPKLTLKYALLAPIYYKNWLTYYYDLLRLGTGKNLVLNLRSGVGFNIIGSTVARDIINEVFVDKVYENKSLDIYIRDSDTILDVGAHIGIFTTYASVYANDCQVYSFEPVKPTFDLLQANLSKNNLKNVKINNKGIFSKTTTAVIEKSGAFYASSSLYKELMQNQGLTVNAQEEISLIGINDFLRSIEPTTVNFVKMDCEGSEYEIIYNMEPQYLAKIRCFVIEYHNVPNAPANFNGKDLKVFFEKNNFKVLMKNTHIDSTIGYLYCRNSLIK